MKRGAPLSRSRMARGHTRVGAAAAKRRQAGGKMAVGRDSATVAEYREIKAAIGQRSGGRCEVTLRGPSGAWWRCERVASDPCHVSNRSQGERDSVDRIYHGCRYHNMQQAAAYIDGRLVVFAQGGGRFDFHIVFAKDKFEARGRDEELDGKRSQDPRTGRVAAGD